MDENSLGEHGPRASEVGIVSCISSFEIEGSIIINRLFYVSKLSLPANLFVMKLQHTRYDTTAPSASEASLRELEADAHYA